MLQVNGAFAVLIGFVTSIFAASLVAQELSDPTMPPQLEPRSMDKQKTSSGVRLQSIQFMGTKRSAVINGQRVYSGDKFEQYVVEKIDLNVVTLRDQKTDKIKVLALFELTKDSINFSGNQL